MIQVEVTYARPERQDVIPVKLPAGATLQQAVEKSGLPAKYPEIDLAKGKFGIYSKLAKAGYGVARPRSRRNLPPADRRPEGSAQAARRRRQGHEEGRRRGRGSGAAE